MADEPELTMNELMRRQPSRTAQFYDRLREAPEREEPDPDGEPTYGRPRPQPKEYEQVVDGEGVKNMAVWNLDELKGGLKWPDP